MKRSLSPLYILFLIAMCSGIYVAFRDSEGLVENNYYEKGERFFQSRASEEKLGIAISRPASLRQGNNNVEIKVTSHGKPLEHALLQLFIGNLSSTAYDVTRKMEEISPGCYQATVSAPFRGVWLLRVDLEGEQQLNTARKWFFSIK